MGLFTWITQKVLKHSSRGDFDYKDKKPTKMRSGGHGEENRRYLDKYRINYGTSAEYTNGVRFGYVEKHKNPHKRHGNSQAWFPRGWTRKDIKKAGQHVSGLKKNRNHVDGQIYTGRYRGVSVGIIYKKKDCNDFSSL